MAWTLRSIDVAGDPTGDANTDEPLYLPVRLTYADAESVDAAAEWLQVRIQSPASFGNVLAEVERYALEQLQGRIRERIAYLTSLRQRA